MTIINMTLTETISKKTYPGRDREKWMEVDFETAKAAFEAGEDFLVEGVQSWTTPRNVSGHDVGWFRRVNGEVWSCQTWHVRFSVTANTLFGSGGGSYRFWIKKPDALPEPKIVFEDDDDFPTRSRFENS